MVKDVIISIHSSYENIESVWLYGSLPNRPEQIVYTSDIDLVTYLDSDISEKDFKNLRTIIFENIKPIADIFGKYVAELIQVNQKAKSHSYFKYCKRLL